MVKNDYRIGREKFLTLEQTDKLIQRCEEKSAYDMKQGRVIWPVRLMLAQLALNTGLRVSEIAQLEIRDIHLNGDQYIHVRHGKRNKQRDVYISKKLVKKLKDFIEYKDKTLGQAIEKKSPLFCGRGGRHVTSTALIISFTNALKEAGLPVGIGKRGKDRIQEGFSIHSCRHTYATRLLHKTGNLKFTQKQLGHSSIMMTSLYSDIWPEENSKLINMLDD